jgi:hypothetical protein
MICPIPYKRHVSCAGRRKIRGGGVALAEAVRIFLIFCFFLIKQKEKGYHKHDEIENQILVVSLFKKTIKILRE